LLAVASKGYASDAVDMGSPLALIAGLLLAPLVNLTAAEAAHAPLKVLFIAIDEIHAN